MGSIENPRIRGIVEQLERARMFHAEGIASSDPTSSFRHLMASVYFGRAVLELMREAAKAGELRVGAPALDERLAGIVPRYRLIRELRIRDFHRFGIMGPGHMLFEGRMSLPPLGTATIEFYADADNPRLSVRTSDGSTEHEFVLTSGLLVQDQLEVEPVRLDDLLNEYLKQLPEALKEFRSLAK